MWKNIVKGVMLWFVATALGVVGLTYFNAGNITAMLVGFMIGSGSISAAAALWPMWRFEFEFDD
jgi:hypothetical protein